MAAFDFGFASAATRAGPPPKQNRPPTQAQKEARWHNWCIRSMVILRANLQALKTCQTFTQETRNIIDEIDKKFEDLHVSLGTRAQVQRNEA